jgi:hypothetical protein
MHRYLTSALPVSILLPAEVLDVATGTEQVLVLPENSSVQMYQLNTTTMKAPSPAGRGRLSVEHCNVLRMTIRDFDLLRQRV